MNSFALPLFVAERFRETRYIYIYSRSVKAVRITISFLYQLYVQVVSDLVDHPKEITRSNQMIIDLSLAIISTNRFATDLKIEKFFTKIFDAESWKLVINDIPPSYFSIKNR